MILLRAATLLELFTAAAEAWSITARRWREHRSQTRAACPKRAVRTGCASWEIDSFLVGAAHDRFRSEGVHDHVLLHESDKFVTNRRIVPDICIRGEPFASSSGLQPRTRNDGGDQLRGELIGRTEGYNSGERVFRVCGCHSLKCSQDFVPAPVQQRWVGECCRAFQKMPD